MSSFVINFVDRTKILMITWDRKPRPSNPRRCNPKRYHVWRWRGGPAAPAETLCQCGLLDDPPRHS